MSLLRNVLRDRRLVVREGPLFAVVDVASMLRECKNSSAAYSGTVRVKCTFNLGRGSNKADGPI